MTALLEYKVADGIGAINFTRSECRNALSKELLLALAAALGRARAEAVHAVVISGEGGVFSAGADLRELDGTAADAGFDDHVAAAVDAIQSAPMPLIAAIEGACIGAALDIALACDFRVVAESAFLELPAIRLGLLYNPRALARIGQQLPSATLSRLLLAGERIEGRDAVAAGLATHRAAEGDAVTQALGLAARFSSLPAGAVETTKRFICALGASSLDPAVWQHERMALLSSHARRAAIDRAQNRPGT
jgi:enoyl-CoA hydratase/carnithine racemase